MQRTDSGVVECKALRPEVIRCKGYREAGKLAWQTFQERENENNKPQSNQFSAIVSNRHDEHIHTNAMEAICIIRCRFVLMYNAYTGKDIGIKYNAWKCEKKNPPTR